MARVMRQNPVYYEVNVTTDWQEVKCNFIPQAVIIANVSAGAGTIRFKTQDDGPSGDPGGQLIAFSALDKRVIDFVICDRVLFRSDDLNQVIYVEFWKGR